MATRRSKPGLAKAKRGLRVEGLDDVLDNISRVLDQMSGSAAKEVFTHAAVVVRDHIRAVTPVRTGKLKSAIFAARGDDNQSNALVGVNYKIAPHAHLVEFGHAGKHPAPPHPYFRPGLVNAKSTVKSIITAGLNKVLEDAVKR